MTAQEWEGQLEFRIWAFSCDPCEISKALGVEPTKVGRRGERSSLPLPHVLKVNSWTRGTPLTEDGWQREVDGMLSKFPSNLDVLKTVTASWDPGLAIVLYMRKQMPRVVLDQAAVRRLVQLHADFDLSMYVLPVDDDPIEEEPDWETEDEQGWSGEVAFEILGFDCDPAEVSRTLQCQPTETWIGEQGTESQGDGCRSSNGWRIQSAPLTDLNVQEEVDALLARMPTDLGSLRSITEEWRSAMVFRFEMPEHCPPSWLSCEALERLAGLGAAVHINLSPGR